MKLEDRITPEMLDDMIRYALQLLGEQEGVIYEVIDVIHKKKKNKKDVTPASKDIQ